jgi:hypothetical protein
MFCSKCGTEAVANAKFCANCGSPMVQQGPTPAAPSITARSSASDRANFSDGFSFSKLARGEYGLAKTYWLYGVLVGFVVNIVFSVVQSPGIIAIGLVVYTAYGVPVIMGIWRAAAKYTGPKIWAILAKIACVLDAFMLLTADLLAIVVLMQSV